MTPNEWLRGKRGEPGVMCALAAGAKMNEAARQGGVSVATVDRRLRDPEYRALIVQAREQMIDRAVGIIAANAAEATEVLVRLMRAADADYVRLGAADKLLARLPLAKALERNEESDVEAAKANVLSLVTDSRRAFGA